MADKLKEALACWHVSLDVSCPHCGNYFDIMESNSWHDGVWERVEVIQRNDLDLEVECPQCKKTFYVDGAEY